MLPLFAGVPQLCAAMQREPVSEPYCVPGRTRSLFKVEASCSQAFSAHCLGLTGIGVLCCALQAVVKLPFVDVKRLAAAAQQQAQDERELTQEEEVSSMHALRRNVLVI